MMFNVCTKCNERKPQNAFYRHGDGYKKRCRTCVNQEMFIYSRKRYASLEGRASQIFNNAKCRSKKYGIIFTVDRNYILLLLIVGHCSKSGIRFDLSPAVNGANNPFAPSIDKIIPSKGYTNENVQLVCNMYNMGKSDHAELDFIAMCVAVAERHKDDPRVISRLAELRNAV